MLNTDNYEECVLTAVNLGDDTDTIAAIAGGLARIAYGRLGIPTDWMNQLVKRTYIEELCTRFTASIQDVIFDNWASSPLIPDKLYFGKRKNLMKLHKIQTVNSLEKLKKN